MRRLGSGVFAIVVAAITLGRGRSQASPPRRVIRVFCRPGARCVPRRCLPVPNGLCADAGYSRRAAATQQLASIDIVWLGRPGGSGSVWVCDAAVHGQMGLGPPRHLPFRCPCARMKLRTIASSEGADIPGLGGSTSMFTATSTSMFTATSEGAMPMGSIWVGVDVGKTHPSCRGRRRRRQGRAVEAGDQRPAGHHRDRDPTRPAAGPGALGRRPA
jgi:hypothetical protein